MNCLLKIVLACSALLVACGDSSSWDPNDDEELDSSVSSSDTSENGDDNSVSSSSSAISNTDPEYSSEATLQYSSSTENVFMGTMTDERDGQTYKTIKIGTQTWMAENLNYAYTGIPYDFEGYTSDSTSWCYNDSAKYCAKYGRFYSWSTAMDSAARFSDNGKGCSYGSDCVPTYPVRGVCPEGWHLPSFDEWKALIAAIGGYPMSGLKLKSTWGWNRSARAGDNSSGNGWDSFGFNALPVGDMYHGTFSGLGRQANFWSSSMDWRYKEVIHARLAFHDSSAATLQSMGAMMNSVRCLKDEGDIMKNVTMGTMTDERDGQTYKTIKIGAQTWMAENLNYAYTGIPYNFDRKDSSDSISWCYNDSAEYCAKYGRLYTWAAAMDSAALLSDNGEGCGFEVECTPTYPVRGVCPSGWHVPTYEEFETLFEAVGNRRIAGLVLKSFEGWHENGNGTYDFGFKALPAGSRNHEGRFGNEGDIAFFWSSTTLKYSRAEYMCLDWDEEEASYWLGDNYLEWVAKRYKTNGFSVRCVKD